MSSAVEEYDLTAADQFHAPLAVTASPADGAFRALHAAPFLLSLVAHLGVVLSLSLYQVQESKSGGRRLIISAPATTVQEFEELQRVQAVEVDAITIADDTAPVSAIENSGDVGESLPSPLSVVADRGERQVGSSALADVMGLFKGAGDGFADAGQGEGGAEFFGVKAGGRKFVFVVDSSRSMRGRKWTKACQELLASVRRMNSQQSFYVIFFDVDTHPMFSQKRPEKDLLPVTSGNQKKLLRWLPSIKLGPDTRPLHSMRIALAMKPDAIFLLSDGEFDDGTRSFLLDENFTTDDDGKRVPKIPIHTVGFHSAAAEASLRPIAVENGGIYRFVPGHLKR